MHPIRTTLVPLVAVVALIAAAAVAHGGLTPAASVRPGSLLPVVARTDNQYQPAVFGNLIAWTDTRSGDGDIYAREMDTGPETPVVVETEGQSTAVAFGKRIAWIDSRYSGGSMFESDIFMRDLAEGVETPVTTDPGLERTGDLFGDHLVWYTDALMPISDIHVTDLSNGSTRPIVELDGAQHSPMIHGDLVVWATSEGVDGDVYMTDLSTGQHAPVSSAADRQSGADVYGDVVVWMDYRNAATGPDIYMRDLSTGQESPVCVADGGQYYPRIFGDLIVWRDERGFDWDIYMYDVSTGEERPVTTAAGNQLDPAVYGHVVAWTHYNVIDNDVYMARIDGPPTRFFALEGPTRYETAAAASAHAYRSKVPEDREGHRTVVLATGRNWPDALGASALAGVLDAPVLITQPDYVPQAVLDEIARLDADRVVFVGGEDVVTPAVQTELTAAGITRFERAAGPTRYETADAVAYRTVTLQGGAYDGTALVATGLDFPDALAAAPIAGAKGWPIFLAGPAGITQNSWAVMETIGVQRVHILGGTGAVSAAVEQDLASRLGTANVERHAGPTRYETAVEVASFGIEDVGMQWDELAVATGEDFPDALTGGALQARTHSVLLLTRRETLPAAAGVKLAEWRDYIARVQYLGGTDVVTPGVRNEVAQILH
jgi:beta propeller repeat protein